MRAAGGILIGRTNLPAFSMRAFSDNALHGRTLNPLDPTVSAGGSSGGAGASVATGIGAIAHGNDIAGSVRIPALYNGVIALRPSLGRVPAFNPSQQVARPFAAQMMSVQGPHTRSVRDCRLALAAMAKGDPRDTRWVDTPLHGAPVPKRVALVVENPGGTLHPAQAEAVRHGISRALCEVDAEKRPAIKRAGFLTRDARKKERKKYGQPGARKRFQYSKR